MHAIRRFVAFFCLFFYRAPDWMSEICGVCVHCLNVCCSLVLFICTVALDFFYFSFVDFFDQIVVIYFGF